MRLVWMTVLLGCILLAIVCASPVSVAPCKTVVDLGWTKSHDGNTWVAISLPHRLDSHYHPLRRRLSSAGFDLNIRLGINGKEVALDDYPLSTQYRQFFEHNTRERQAGRTTVDYRGHLGCTLTHLDVIRTFAESNAEGGLMILEDDADPTPDFARTWPAVVAAVDAHDAEWDIVLGGFSCDYVHHPYHKLNDAEPIWKPGFVKVHYWIGGWAYLIRNTVVARKIVQEFEPKITWHVDLCLSDATRLGRLHTYGAMPVIWRHPGTLRASSYDHTQVGDVRLIKSDTNH